jgi:hypothetical protein
MKKKFAIVQAYSDKRYYLHISENEGLTFLPNLFPNEAKLFDERKDAETFITDDPFVPQEVEGFVMVEEIYIEEPVTAKG